MSATYDNANHNTMTNTVNSYPTLTISIAQNNSSEGAVFLAVTHCNVVGLVVGDSGEYISSVTYNGDNMTYITSIGLSTHTIEYYYHVGSSGTHNVVVTFDNTTTPGDPVVVTAHGQVVSLYNVNQTTPVQSYTNNWGTTSPITISLTTNNSMNMNIDANASFGGTATITVTGTNQTERKNVSAGTKGATMRCGLSTQPSTAASQTMSWSQSINRNWIDLMVEVKGTSGASASKGLAALGVG